MVKVVIFDLDDTLIPERKFIESGYNHIANLISKNFNLEHDIVFNLLMGTFEKKSTFVFNRVLEKLDIKYNENYISKLVSEYRNHKPNITVYPDVLPSLNYLRENDIKLGIISDGYYNSQFNKLEAININYYFEHIILTDKLGKKYWKPHTKSFKIMQGFFDVDYAEMIYIGDNIEKDFVAPNRLGMKSVIIKRDNSIYSNLNWGKYDSIHYPMHSINQLTDIVFW